MKITTENAIPMAQMMKTPIKCFVFKLIGPWCSRCREIEMPSWILLSSCMMIVCRQIQAILFIVFIQNILQTCKGFLYYLQFPVLLYARFGNPFDE